MKKCKIYRHMMILAISILAPNLPAAETVNINLQKIKDLNERFNLVQKANRDYKNAAKSYDECIQQNCKNELQALTKIVDDLSKTRLTDTTLRPILLNSKVSAEENLQTCITEKCAQIKSNYTRIVRKYAAIVVGVISAILVPTFIYTQRQSRKETLKRKEKVREAQEAMSIDISNIMEKYGIKDDEESRMILTQYKISKTFDRKYIPRLTGPLLKAMAAIYFQKAELAEKDLDLFIEQFWLENKVNVESLKKLATREEKEEIGLR